MHLWIGSTDEGSRLMKWTYRSENVPGNVHQAAYWVSTNHPEWDVVAMSFNDGLYTTVVYRLLRMERNDD